MRVKLQFNFPDFPISRNVSWEVNLQRLQKHRHSTKVASDLQYNVTIQLANAANYGVPQHRHRVFFVGFRTDLDSKWFFPSPTTSEEELLRAQFVDNTYWKEHGLNAPPSPGPAEKLRRKQVAVPELFSSPGRWRTVRDAIAGLGDPQKQNQHHNHCFQPGAKVYPGHTGSPLDEPSKALKAGDHGVPGGENMMRYPNGEVRYFTLRESARIQTFPDDYIFTGSWSESMRQLGNAVPVALAQAFAQSISAHLKPHSKIQTALEPPC